MSVILKVFDDTYRVDFEGDAISSFAMWVPRYTRHDDVVVSAHWKKVPQRSWVVERAREQRAHPNKARLVGDVWQLQRAN
jgi:hypothetical protein